jgi:REP element-mobilizing transposase RayT
MASTFVNIRVHVIFSTAGRRELIRENLRDTLWQYIRGIGRNNGIAIDAVGGMSDHIHLLLMLPAQLDIAKAIQTIKANSSRWMRQSVRGFRWQDGYAALSVSASNARAVADYIEHQPEHHRKRSFADELKTSLRSTALAMTRSTCSAKVSSRRDSPQPSPLTGHFRARLNALIAASRLTFLC